jgi:osomolarity two-component system sensor histidine kinase NIK1
MAAETYSSVSAIIRNLARQHDPARDPSFSAQVSANGAKTAAIALPGPESEEKTQLEQELSALCSRIDFLEHKNSLASTKQGQLPLTPAQEPPEDGVLYTPAGVLRGNNGPPAQGRRGSNKERAIWVSNWLAAKESNGDPEQPAAALTEEQLNYLRVHLNQQADQIRNQREHIGNDLQYTLHALMLTSHRQLEPRSEQATDDTEHGIRTRH